MQIFVQLGAMVNKVSECGLLGWFGCVRLISCICNFVLLNPQIGQVPKPTNSLDIKTGIRSIYSHASFASFFSVFVEPTGLSFVT